ADMAQVVSPPPDPAPAGESGVDVPQLERSLRHPRTAISGCLTLVVGAMALFAMIPLFSVLYMLVVRGGIKLLRAGYHLFTQLPPAAGMPGGGIGNALVGTLVVVGIATLVSVPVGILGAVFLAEFGPESRTATVVRFCAKILTGLPSVLAGLVAYA